MLSASSVHHLVLEASGECDYWRSEEHTSELQSQSNLVCRLLLEKKNVHMYRGMPYRSYFQHIEEIFKRYQGRPHWGKMHTRAAAELIELYPRWYDFQRTRATLDPQGMFLNDYLRALFGTDTPEDHDPSSIPGVSAKGELL